MPAEVCLVSHCECMLGLMVYLALTPGLSLANPPYATDDPEPVDYKHWELYLPRPVEKSRCWLSVKSTTSPTLKRVSGSPCTSSAPDLMPSARPCPPLMSACRP
jgi:hypothetical protein